MNVAQTTLDEPAAIDLDPQTREHGSVRKYSQSYC